MGRSGGNRRESTPVQFILDSDKSRAASPQSFLKSATPHPGTSFLKGKSVRRSASQALPGFISSSVARRQVEPTPEKFISDLSNVDLESILMRFAFYGDDAKRILGQDPELKHLFESQAAKFETKPDLIVRDCFDPKADGFYYKAENFDENKPCYLKDTGDFVVSKFKRYVVVMGTPDLFGIEHPHEIVWGLDLLGLRPTDPNVNWVYEIPASNGRLLNFREFFPVSGWMCYDESQPGRPSMLVEKPLQVYSRKACPVIFEAILRKSSMEIQCINE